MRLLKLSFLVLPAMFALLNAKAETSPCTASFPVQAGKAVGWQGGDAAYSVPLPDGRDIWIFGDTLYGPERIVVGNEPRMVHNSLGISTCKNGKWTIDYAIRRDASGKALSFFSPSDPKRWYWALDGFYADGSLWVTLLCIRHPAAPAPAGFDFESCGSDLAQISSLDKDPQHWGVTIRPLVADGVKAYPSATTLVHDGYAYLFASYENGTRPLVATRIALGKLSDPAANLEYLAAEGGWKPGFEPAKAKQVMARGSTELSIRYHPERKEWLAVMVDPAPFSDKIILRTAPDLAGPWTEGNVIYTMPEMQPGPLHDKNIFCYAGKEHTELETASNLVFTYVCNTMLPSQLATRRDIYQPQIRQQAMPALHQFITPREKEK